MKSVCQKQWKLRDLPPPELLEHLGGSPIPTTLLYQRFYDPAAADPLSFFQAAVDDFLHATYGTGLHDPLLMKGMAEASQRIARAIAQGEQMAVYGDFDTDGVTAVALLMQAIPALRPKDRMDDDEAPVARLMPYIPHREQEGYGLNIDAIERLAAAGVRLLITVDCGISNVAEVQRANELGIDVIVTDHHQPPAVLPPALAIVNPKQSGCAYPYKQLVGVGIAFKLVHALFKQGLRLKDVRGRDLLDVVALGTVADMGPLTGENRVLVRAGLDAMRQTERPGLLALMKEARVPRDYVDSTAIGFLLGPRINAAGRLDDARRAYELLLAQDLATAERLAQELNRANRERQAITRSIVEEACLQAEVSGKDAQRIVLLDSEHYPSGIVGLVAGKLVERWARPVILVARGPDESRGSARSIERYNIYHALSACQEQFAHDNPGKDLFVRFGGHSRAAGFTILNEHLPELEARMLAQAEAQLTDDLLEPLLVIDMEVPLHALTWELYDQLAALEPYGQVNHQPLLLSRGVHVLQQRSIGSDGRHLKLTVIAKNARGQATPLEAIAFGFGDQAEELRAHPDIDLVYTLEANIWKGTESLQLNVKDFRYC